VPRTRFFPVLGVLLIGGCGLAGPAFSQPPEPSGNLYDVVLPCGVRAALDAMGDRSTPDRGQFILEITRRYHQSPVGENIQRTDALRALLTHLDRCGTAGQQATGAETLPLPLPVSMWVDTVFGSRVNAGRLAAAILESRNASLLYAGLLSLDEATRNWIAGRPDLVAEIVTRHAAAFTLIAPGLHVTSAGVQVPGGQPAEPVWEGLVGRSAKDPAAFVRALLIADERYLPYMFGAFAQLSPAEAHLALHLDARDPADRIASARRLHAIYSRIAHPWRVESRAYWRPTYDPALLVVDLRHDEEGRPVLPGTHRFWTAVFADGGPANDDPREIVKSEPVEFAWLCERIFDGDTPRHRSRYHQVLFASRLLRTVNAEQAIAAVEAVRAAHRYPALVAALERAGVADVTVIAAAARRAAALADIGNVNDSIRASAQFQGLLTLFQRATLRNSISSGAFAELVASLVAVDLTDDQAYQGGLVRWLGEQLRQRDPRGQTDFHDLDAQPVERALLALAAGPDPSTAAARIVEWEGTRYRVDPVAAEAARLERLRGEDSRPYVSAAHALIGIAGALRDLKLSRDALSREAVVFARVDRAVGWDSGQNWSADQHWLGGATLDRARDVAAAFQRVERRGDRGGAARLAPAILALADDLLARGVTELVYATALGRPERAEFSAEEAAAHHDFGLRRNGVRNSLGPWEHPALSSASGHEARVVGSLLGLDVALAGFSLVRLSSKLPPRRPTLEESDRRALIESVALVRELDDGDRDRIVGAIRTGRDRLAAAATSDQAIAMADEIGMIGARRSLLAWSVTRTPDRAAAFLSPGELLWLGLGPTPMDAHYDAWGAPARARLGCLCLRLVDRRPPEIFTGRWGAGIFVSAFPDLNLRLAELLAELRMPAALLGPVLTSATLDLVNNTPSRDADDRRSLVEFVSSLTLDRLEQYLALLTTDGPLVPIGKAAETSVSAGVPR
jgi:hypothetical protein